MTFSMPSPVELTQLKIQYQRNVGTASASNRIELGATAPAPGSTSSASTFLSLTRERLGFTAAGPVPGSGPRARRTLPAAARVRADLSVRRRGAPGGPRLAHNPLARATRGRDHIFYGVMKSWVTMRP